MEEADLPASPQLGASKSRPPIPGSNEELSKLAARISSKLEMGDFKGAVHLACSKDSIAPINADTIAQLRLKHPAPHHESTNPPPPSDDKVKESLTMDENTVIRAIQSYPKGSTGGTDGLCPQHLRDMISPAAGEGRTLLLRALVKFTNLVLTGNIPDVVRPLFFGASLTALNKTGGGVRPIAVGCTLRRLVTKTASMDVMNQMSEMLAPLQLGYGVGQGAEAAVHATRIYLENLPPNNILLKLDFRNAFNSIRRDKLLEAARVWVPEIFPFVHSSYSAPSNLYYSDTTLQSSEGVRRVAHWVPCSSA